MAKKTTREILKLLAALALCAVFFYLIYALFLNYSNTSKYSHPYTRGVRY